ncbi:excinuclease ABC subunit C [Pseudonocardiaceae bacterium YIM PH 21723]|nr:excinuclease ABC subunit C [Pseudonocardiaceae bacterium YIM PH 21723]
MTAPLPNPSAKPEPKAIVALLIGAVVILLIGISCAANDDAKDVRPVVSIPSTTTTTTTTTTTRATTTTTTPPPTTTTTTVAPPPPPPVTQAPQPVIPAPQTYVPPAPAPQGGSAYYANCTAAKQAGAAPLYRGQPGYRAALDRDNDGVACE